MHLRLLKQAAKHVGTLSHLNTTSIKLLRRNVYQKNTGLRDLQLKILEDLKHQSFLCYLKTVMLHTT